MKYSWMILGLALHASAASLSSVAEDALKTNTNYLSALAGAAAVQDVLKIHQAAWLPQLSLDATKGSSQYKEITGGAIVSLNPGDEIKNLTYGLNLNQKLFDMQSWLTFKKQSFLVQQALFNAAATKQELLYDVAIRYFAVLQDYSAYENEQIKLKAYQEQLRKVKQEFNAGKAAKPELSQVQAQYLLAKAETLSAKNALMHEVQKLTEMTGKSYKFIYRLGDNIPLHSPKPNKVKSWVNLMQQHNLSLKSAHAAMLASEKEIDAVRAAGIPVMAFASSWIHQRPLFMQPDTSSYTMNWSLSFSWPLFTGGADTARYSQSQHTGAQTRQMLISKQRNLTQKTINSFNDINLGIERVRAAREAVSAAKTAKVAYDQGYSAGTQTVTDVLQAISRLHEARLQLIKSKFAYITEALHLKLLVGALTIKDLQALSPLFLKQKRYLNLY